MFVVGASEQFNSIWSRRHLSKMKSILCFSVLLFTVAIFGFVPSRFPKFSIYRKVKFSSSLKPLQAIAFKPQLQTLEKKSVFLSPNLIERNGSVSLNTLMQMTGLNEVKQHFQNIYDSVAIAKKQGVWFNDSNFNVQMVGNHGIGKTTVAHLYANFLKEIAVLPKDAVNVILSGIHF